jgi:GATA-binding protein
MSRDNFFLAWRDNHAGEELEDSDKMQRKDPLAIQMWRLYSMTKKELPSHERMENLTWRVMVMSLLKSRQEQAARYVQNKT